MYYNALFWWTGMLFWTASALVLLLAVLLFIWEGLGTAIFVYKLWCGANFAPMRYPFRVWWMHFGGPHTSILFTNRGVVVRWPRPWYNREADLQLSWNQIPFEDER